MPAFKMSVARISAGLAASALFASTSFAATLVVGNEAALTISSNPGFTYVVNGADGSLSVATDGYLLCSNVGQSVETPVTLMPQHGDWRLPTAQEVLSVSYSGGALGVNRSGSPTLVCHAIGAGGEQPSPFTGGIFRNTYENKSVEQFSNLINWIPSVGFSWNAPNWSLVPTDPCVATGQQVVEDLTCAAVAGSKPAGAGATVRSPTLWTATDGVNFFYIARVDALYGGQAGVDAVGAPLPSFDANSPQGTSSAELTVVDGYDRGIVGVGGGYLGDSGVWCVLNDLPTALDGNVCSGAPVSGTLNGPIGTDFAPFAVGVPPFGIPHLTFYLAFIRPIVGPPPSVNEPAVAVSIQVEPSILAEGGDRFKGDDVAFGFLPASTGFPWMDGSP